MFKHRKGAVSALLVAAAAVLAQAAEAQQNFSIYGYFATRLEKTYNEPSFDGSGIVKESSAREWGMPFFNVMMQHQPGDRFRVYVNLNGSGAENIDVRNAWGEVSLSNYLAVRVGKDLPPLRSL